MQPQAYARVEALVDELAAWQPNRIALVFGQRRWTYVQLRDEVHRRAAILIEADLLPGDVVATTEPVSDDAAITFFACCRADLTFLGLSSQLTPAESLPLLRRADTKLALTADGAAHDAAPTLPSRPLALPGIASDHSFVEATRRSAAGTADAVASLVPTSGTTGDTPKLVRMPHRTMTFLRGGAAQGAQCREVSYSPQSTQFMVRRVVEDFSREMMIVLSRAIDPQRIEAEMAACQATALRTVPAVLRLLVDQRDPPPERLVLSSVRTLSAPLPIPVLCAAKARYGGIVVINAYGSSECGSLTEAREDAPAGSVGKPIPGVDLRLVDDVGHDVHEGEIGELIARSPGMTLGYLDDAAATDRLLRDGWMWSGDLARRDEGGSYRIMGRRALRINVGGLKVLPEEVEAVLEQHPRVREAVAVPCPDPSRGEVVRAVIVPEGTPPSIGDLRRFCRERLAGYKIPRHWEFRDDLPRSPLGEVLRRRV